MKVLLYAPQYRPNMSSMIRTAEFYGLDRIYIYDENQLLKPPVTKKDRANMQHMGRVWTAGAVDHIEIVLVENPIDFIASHKGRKVGTLLSSDSQPLNTTSPYDSDLLIMGPEKTGLPNQIVALIDEAVCIPHKGHTDCLNVAVSFGIFMNKWLG